MGYPQVCSKRLVDVAKLLDAKIQGAEHIAEHLLIEQVYASNRMSELLDHAGPATLIVSDLANSHLIDVAELLDVAGICITGQRAPDTACIHNAASVGKVVLFCPHSLKETCVRLRRWGLATCGDAP